MSAEGSSSQSRRGRAEHDEHAPVVYRIDGDDRLTAVSSSWDRFAEENDTPAMLGDRVIGDELWQFIGDRTTRELYTGFCRRVRGGAPPISFHFRCDSPSHERLLAMLITGLGDGSIEFTVTPLSIRLREPLPLQWIPGADSAAGLVNICSWCERGRLPDGAWAEVEDVVHALGLFEKAVVPGVSHGICDRCESALSDEWEGTLTLAH